MDRASFAQRVRRGTGAPADLSSDFEAQGKKQWNPQLICTWTLSSGTCDSDAVPTASSWAALYPIVSVVSYDHVAIWGENSVLRTIELVSA